MNADVENPVEVFPVHLLAVQELGDRLHLLPGLRRTPFFSPAARRPLRSKLFVGEDVGAEVEVVGVGIDRDPVGFTVPGADGGLEKLDIIGNIDLLCYPIRHGCSQTFA